MPFNTREDARNDIQSVFHTAWSTQAAPVPLVLYQNKKGIPPVDGSPYVSVNIAHTSGNQTTLASIGSRRFTQRGLITVAVFEKLGEGLTTSDQRVKIITDAFEGVVTPGRVIFTNVRASEIGKLASWYQVNVLIEFEYDLIK